jgi:DNA-binding GntR family transcriptional regulator
MPTKTAQTPIDEICNRLWLAIAERKLRPGARLKEEDLSAVFSVSRARVRQALARLEVSGLVTLMPNRGAVVAEPSIEEARDIFFARRTIEDRLVERVCTNVTPEAMARLRAHLEEERAAHERDDTSAIIQLSGGFHLLIAELAGSRYLGDVLRELISRTSLIIAMYQSRAAPDCGPQEHEEIIRMIEAGDIDGTKRAMAKHLAHIENALDLKHDKPRQSELKDILARDG